MPFGKKMAQSAPPATATDENGWPIFPYLLEGSGEGQTLFLRPACTVSAKVPLYRSGKGRGGEWQ